MKKKLLGGLALALLLAGCGNSGDSDKEKTDDGKKTYKLGIIQQMEHPALDSAREGLEKYLNSKSDAKFEITVKMHRETMVRRIRSPSSLFPMMWT